MKFSEMKGYILILAITVSLISLVTPAFNRIGATGYLKVIPSFVVDNGVMFGDIGLFVSLIICIISLFLIKMNKKTPLPQRIIYFFVGVMSIAIGLLSLVNGQYKMLEIVFCGVFIVIGAIISFRALGK